MVATGLDIWITLGLGVGFVRLDVLPMLVVTVTVCDPGDLTIPEDRKGLVVALGSPAPPTSLVKGFLGGGLGLVGVDPGSLLGVDRVTRTGAVVEATGAGLVRKGFFGRVGTRGAGGVGFGEVPPFSVDPPPSPPAKKACLDVGVFGLAPTPVPTADGGLV